MQTLLRLIATQPQLLAEHAQAYSELFAQESSSLWSDWRRRALLRAAALCSLSVAAVLAGVALMLWAVALSAAPGVQWVLLVVPLPPLLAGGYCLLAAQLEPMNQPLEELRRQLAQDLALLREASTA